MPLMVRRLIWSLLLLQSEASYPPAISLKWVASSLSASSTILLLLALLRNIPVVHACGGDFHCLQERNKCQPSERGSKERDRRLGSSSFSFLQFHATYRHLLAQEIEVFLAVAQALLRGAELVCEELFGFGDGVGEHDVGLAKEKERESVLLGRWERTFVGFLWRRKLDRGFFLDGRGGISTHT